MKSTRSLFAVSSARSLLIALGLFLAVLPIQTQAGSATPPESDEALADAVAAFADGDPARGKAIIENRVKALKGRPDYKLILASEYRRLAAYQYNQSNYELSLQLGEAAAEAIGDPAGIPDKRIRMKAMLRLGEIKERLLHRPEEALDHYLDASVMEPENAEAARRIGRIDRKAEALESNRLAAARLEDSVESSEPHQK